MSEHILQMYIDLSGPERQKKVFSNLFLDILSGAAPAVAFVYSVSALITLHWENNFLTS